MTGGSGLTPVLVAMLLFAGFIFGVALGPILEGDDEGAVTAVEFDEHGVVCFVDTSTGSDGGLECMALNETEQAGSGAPEAG